MAEEPWATISVQRLLDRAKHGGRALRIGTIHARLLVSFVLIVLVLASAISIATAIMGTQSGRQRVVDQLQSVATLKEAEIEAWVRGLGVNLDIVVSGPQVMDRLKRLTQESVALADYQSTYNELQEHFRWAVGQMEQFEELFLMDLGGRVVLSTSTAQEGQVHSNWDYFQEGLKGDYTQPPSYSLSSGVMSVIVTRPIYQGRYYLQYIRQSAEGEVLGVLAGRASLERLNEIMLERAGLGETGETYLVGSNHALLTTSRFTGHRAGETYVHTDGANTVLEGQADGFGTYVGYRDVLVVGVYRWLPTLQAALLAEQDEAEALGSTYDMLGIIGVVALLTAVVTGVAAVFITRGIANPVARLAETATRIAAGDLGRTASVERGDEIGILAQAFNSMTAQLRDLIGNLEERVGDRTRELERLEQLGRAIINAPPDASTLPDLLRENVPDMLPHSRIEARIFPDETVLCYPDEGSYVSPATWEWLATRSDAEHFLPGAALPWASRSSDSAVIVAPILDVRTADTIGGIYLSRRWQPEAIASLLPAVQSLAAQIATALASARDYQEELAHHRVAQELAAAWRIQASFLPDTLPEVPGWQLAATLKPARETSGDFYDVAVLPGGRLGVLIADVADKGVGAALYMALSRTLIRTYGAEHYARPDLTLEAVNRRLLTDVHYNNFVTVFYGILDLATGTLTYCNAGHDPPRLFRAEDGGKAETLRRTGIALGMFDDVTWEQESVQVAPGDVLLLYTDGITDAQDSRGAFFGEGEWMQAVQANLGRSAQEIQDALIADVQRFVGDAPQYDDIALMVVVRGSEE
jgi:serine phosphatase RsbU (regulator of sigma subunit)/HAMP domain-containing protein